MPPKKATTTEQATAVCTSCKEEKQKTEMSLVKNRWICNQCKTVESGPEDKPKSETPPTVEPSEEEKGLLFVDLDDKVAGMKDICRICKRSESTILNWIKTRDFPAKKMDGGIWYSGKKAITRWWNSQLKDKTF